MILIKWEKSHSDLALEIARHCMSVPTGSAGVFVEKRDGLNIGGGEYFRIRPLGLEINIVRNAGEVSVDAEPQWTYYILLRDSYGVPIDMRYTIEKYIAMHLTNMGMTVRTERN